MADGINIFMRLSGGGVSDTRLLFDGGELGVSGQAITLEATSHVSMPVTERALTVTAQTISLAHTSFSAPVITSNGAGSTASISRPENQTGVTTVTATGSPAPTFSITGGADAAKFSINSSTGVLTFNTAPDYEAPGDANADNVYQVVVQASNGFGTPDTQTISVTVTDVNDTANDAVLLLDTNAWNGVFITPSQNENNNTSRYLRESTSRTAGFGTTSSPNLLWTNSSSLAAYLLYIKGNGNPNPSTTYGGETLQTGVRRPDGSLGTVLRFQIGPDNPPATSVEQVRLTWYQSAGQAGVGGRKETVYYSRRWLKFDERTRNRAAAVGAGSFYEIIEECKCEPDYRFRVQLRYTSSGGGRLYLESYWDVLTNANPISGRHGTNTSVNIVMAPESSSDGWHLFETYINRPEGICKAYVDGQPILNLGPGVNLYGSSGNCLNFPMFLQLYGDSTPPNHAQGPMVMYCADMELWDKPPADAWIAP